MAGDWSAEFAYDYASRLSGVPECTAVFAANDEMAVGLVHGLHERGIAVPDDVSVVGFDDIGLAAHVLPPLSTVRQDFRALGLSAVDMLREAIEGHEPREPKRIPPELVVRASTAPPRRLPI